VHSIYYVQQLPVQQALIAQALTQTTELTKYDALTKRKFVPKSTIGDSKHGLERLACVRLVLSTQPQKPTFTKFWAGQFSMHISRLDWKQPHFWKYNWGWPSKHVLDRRACVQLVLSAKPQKPHCYTILGWTMSEFYLEARLQAAPLLLEIFGLASKHGIKRLAWVHLGLLAQPQKPRFHKSLGLGMLSPILNAAPMNMMLEIGSSY